MNTREIASERRLAHWVQAFQEKMADGESIAAFCQNRGISRNTYFYWQRKIRNAACEQLALKQRETVGVVSPCFTQVQIAGASSSSNISVPAVNCVQYVVIIANPAVGY